MRYHIPVLLHEVLDGLDTKPGGRYIDATIGDGGHTKAIIDHGGVVLGIDRDDEALKRVSERMRFEIEIEKLKIMKGNFEDIAMIATQNNFQYVDGILFDLGMSSFQIEESGRGFTFQKDEPLDMRMDSTLSVTAADLVNALGKKELFDVFTKFGQVERAHRLVEKIVESRKERPIQTTTQLADVVFSVNPRRGRLHPATKIFMALRMAVNDELGSLERTLPKAVTLLRPSGRLAVLSFHEGEDRVVKTFFRSNRTTISEIHPSPFFPSEKERSWNPRARSARLRIGRKIGSFKRSDLA